MATLPHCCCATPTQETAPLRDTDCSVTVCATLVTAGQRKHVLLAVIVSDTAGSSTARRPGSSSFTVADLAQPSLHWGCCPGQGDRWQEPPSGWSTWPDVSHDARECPTPGIGLSQRASWGEGPAHKPLCASLTAPQLSARFPDSSIALNVHAARRSPPQATALGRPHSLSRTCLAWAQR